MLVAAPLVAVALQAPAHATSAGAIIDAVNQDRGGRGLPSLQSYGDASMAKHANDVLVSTGEYHGDRSTVTAWYFDRGADSFRENQAVFPAHGGSATQVVEAWRGSAGHAANLDAPDATHIAVAVRTSGGRTYYTAHLLGQGTNPPSGPPAGSDDPDPPTSTPPEPAPEPEPEPEPERGSDPDPEPESDPATERGSDPDPAPEADPAPESPSESDSEPKPDPGSEPEGSMRDLSALRAPVPDRSSARMNRPDGGGDQAHRHPLTHGRGDVEVAPQILSAPDPDAPDPDESHLLDGQDRAEPPLEVDAATSTGGGEREPAYRWGLLPAAVALALLALRGWQRQRRSLGPG